MTLKCPLQGDVEMPLENIYLALMIMFLGGGEPLVKFLYRLSWGTFI